MDVGDALVTAGLATDAVGVALLLKATSAEKIREELDNIDGASALQKLRGPFGSAYEVLRRRKEYQLPSTEQLAERHAEQTKRVNHNQKLQRIAFKVLILGFALQIVGQVV